MVLFRGMPPRPPRNPADDPIQQARPTMRNTVLRSTSIAVALLATACSERGADGVLAPEQTSAAVSATAQSAGAVVDFDQVVTLFFNFDAKRGLLSVHGAGAFGCAGQQLSIADRQIVDTPSEIQQRLVKIQDGDSWVSVHRASALSDAFPDLCGFLSGPTRVAAGVVRHTQTFTLASFAAHWGGTIRTPSGDPVHLSEIYQLTADIHDPNNPALWALNTAQVILSTGG